MGLVLAASPEAAPLAHKPTALEVARCPPIELVSGAGAGIATIGKTAAATNATLGIAVASRASRSPEIAHSCSLRFEEPHRINEPRQFPCSSGNSTLGEAISAGEASGVALSSIDRGVVQLLR